MAGGMDPDGGGGLKPLGGAVGGAPFAPGGMAGGSASDARITPNNIGARYAKGKRLNNIAIDAGKWVAIDIEVPTVLASMHALDSHLIYSFEVATRSQNFALGAAPDTFSNKCFQLSTGPGNIYLPCPGVWQIYNPGAAQVSMLVIDATDPAVAVRYLAEPGNQGINVYRSNTVAASPTVTSVTSANRYRTGIIFQNDHATLGIRLAFGNDSPLVGTPQGLLIQAGVILQLAGTTLIKQSVQITSTGANGSYQMVELF